MVVRCLHCHEPIEVPNEDDLSKVHCPVCGGSFSLVGEETVSYSTVETRKLGHFELIEQVGLGSFGTVWKARDTQLDRVVAIKMPRAGKLSSDEAELFIREARAAAQLKHPNIVQIHEVGRVDETVYIVSDLVQGATLDEWLTSRRLSPREASELCLQIAEALDHAHRSGVIHRDLKPGNIMLDLSGRLYLLDFGLARRVGREATMTVDGRVLGTPAYMSPEQARGEAHTADPRTDIYSLGVVLFRLLTGELPFRGNAQMLIVQILQDEPPSPRKLNGHIPRDLETICLKCLEKEPEKRYSNAREVAEDLGHYLAGEPIAARPITRLGRGWRWCKRKPVVAGLSISVLGLIVLVTLIASIGFVRETLLRRQLENRNYFMTISRAFQAWQNGNIPSAKEILDTVSEGSVAESEQGIEVRCLRQLLEDAEPNRTFKLDTLASSLAFSPDNRFLALGFNNGAVEVRGLSIQEENEEQNLPLKSSGIGERIYSLMFSPDGLYLLAGQGHCEDGEVILWRVPKENSHFGEGHVIVHHKAPVAALTLIQDRPDIGTSADLVGTVKQWRIPSGKVLSEGTVQPPNGRFDEASVSADGNIVAFEDKRIVDVWGKIGQTSLGRFMPEGFYRKPIALSPKGDLLAFASGWSVRIVELPAPQSSAEIPALCRNRAFSLNYSADGTLLAVGGDSGRPFVSLWDVRTRRQLGRFVQGTGIGYVSVSPDGRWLASADNFLSPDRPPCVKLWDLRRLQKTYFVTDDDWYQPIALSSDEKTVACRGANNQVVLWDTETGTQRLLAEHDNSITDLALSPDGRTLATASLDCAVRLWDVKTGTLVAQAQHVGEVYSVEFASADGNKVVSGGSNGELWFWDRKAKRRIRLRGHHEDIIQEALYMPSTVCCLKSSPDFRYIISGTVWGKRQEAIIWKVSVTEPEACGKPIVVAGVVSSISFSPNSQYFALGCTEPIVRIRKLSDGKEVVSLRSEGPWMTGAAFSPDGKHFVSAGASGEIRIYRNWRGIGSNRDVTVFRTEDEFRRVEFFPKGKAFVTASMNGHICVWRVPP